MRNLGPREAADEIRSTIAKDQSSRIPPEAAHEVRFIKDVASHLGLEPTPENIQHIALVLREHEIDLPVGQEYPKWVESPVRGQVLVNDAEEEHKATSETPPQPGEDPEPGEVGAGIAHDFDPSSLNVGRGTKSPPYEPFAGSMEPGAPNRPTEPAPVASPVSDNRVNDPAPHADPTHNPNKTPNPQPGDEAPKAPGRPA